MKIIKCMTENIECILDMAETNIMKAIEYKDEFPIAAKAFYNESIILMDSIKGQHDAVVSIIEGYRKEKGEPPRSPSLNTASNTDFSPTMPAEPALPP